VKEFDVEAPELMVCGYPVGPQQECFAALCRVLIDLGCKPGKETARHLAADDTDNAFNSVSITRAGFRHRQFGTVTVDHGYPNSDGSPAAWLRVCVHAPIFWTATRSTRAERRAAEQLGPWTREVLRLGVNRCQVYFGTIGFESSLVPCTELGGGWTGMPSSIFVWDRVLTGHPQVRAAFEADYRKGELEEWGTGRLFSSGPPSGTEWVGASDRTGDLLGKAVHTMTLKAAMAKDRPEASG
jgi:hypothetical protein